MIRSYASWCRRQASAASCFHVVIPCLVLVVLAAWGITEFVTRFALVIEHTALAAAGVLTMAVLTYLLLALGERRGRRWRTARLCRDCGQALAIAEVTYANGLRSDTVRTCGPCWTRAERAAGAAAGWDVDTSGPGLPVITAQVPPEPPVTEPARLPHRQYGTWEELDEAVAGPPASPDNVAASAPLPPELAAYEPGIAYPDARLDEGAPVTAVLIAGAVLAGLVTLAELHGFASHGWGPRLRAWIAGRPAPAPTAHHARHLSRLGRLPWRR